MTATALDYSTIFNELPQNLRKLEFSGNKYLPGYNSQFRVLIRVPETKKMRIGIARFINRKTMDILNQESHEPIKELLVRINHSTVLNMSVEELTDVVPLTFPTQARS